MICGVLPENTNYFAPEGEGWSGTMQFKDNIFAVGVCRQLFHQ
jgi:hypothetical protein